MNFPLILKVIHLSLNTQFKLVGVLWHTGFMWDKEEDNIPFAFDWILHLLERYSRLLLGLKTAHLCFCHKPKRQTTEEEVRPTVIFCFPPSLPPSSWDSLEIKGKQKVLFCSFFFFLCWRSAVGLLVTIWDQLHTQICSTWDPSVCSNSSNIGLAYFTDLSPPFCSHKLGSCSCMVIPSRVVRGSADFPLWVIPGEVVRA